MKRILMLGTVILILALTVAIVSAQSGYDLYQKALVKERAVGDVEAALRLYQRVVQEFAGNRALAAKAHLRMGLLYDRLGRKAEAQRAFQAAVDRYPDQPDVVRQAQAKITDVGTKTDAANTIGKAASTMAIRRVWEGGGVDLLGSLSRDGRYLSFTDWQTGDLAMRDLNTGKNRRLTNKGSQLDSGDFAEYSATSPDGKEVVYAWYNSRTSEKSSYDLRVIGADGSGARVLYSNEDLNWIAPHAWLPDGKQILVTLGRKDKTYQLALIGYPHGSVKVLKTLDWRYPGHPASISPDGVWIAYDFPPEEEKTQRDIFLLATDGTKELKILEHPASDSAPVWTPDGQSIVFISNRSGSSGAYAVRIADGKVQGPPLLIRPDIGPVTVKGFTRNGSYYYGSSRGAKDIYIASLDPNSGKVLAPPAPAVQRFAGFNFAPEWSPDGKHLVFISSRRQMSSGTTTAVLTIRNVETGEERDLQTKLGVINSGNGSLVGMRWSPEGRLILVSGSDKKGRQGLYLVDVKTGDATTIVENQPDTFMLAAVWSADGTSILFVRTENGHFILRKRDVQTGKERELARALPPDLLRDPIVSPDGKRIAFWFRDKAKKRVSIKVMTLIGEASHEVVSLANDSDLVGLRTYAWTTDGRHILYGLRHSNPSAPRTSTSELMLISADGGEPQKLGLTMQGLTEVRLHPDGQRLALSVTGVSNSELWVMENFLPSTEPRKVSVSRR